jgi:hypothetical protein
MFSLEILYADIIENMQILLGYYFQGKRKKEHE